LDFGLLIFVVIITIFSLTMLAYQLHMKKLKQSFGLWFPGILIGLVTLLRGYDIISSLVGWILVSIAIAILLISIYVVSNKTRKTSENGGRLST